MANLLFSTRDLFSKYIQPNQQFIIPAYQRGYKWNSHQIESLLNDIDKFESDGNEELFYCLQNITLVENGKNLHVVDGQQRLTTLALLLAYLTKNELVQNKINYSVRVPSNEFLQGVISQERKLLDGILQNRDFKQFVEEKPDFNYQDIYFMFQAIITFDKWFSPKEASAKEQFKNKLLNQVKLIVNRVEQVNEQELFMNLNAGRVHLDGSDLIRAILITRVAKEEAEQFEKSKIQNIVRINERRVRIGWELDEINKWWSGEKVKGYFSHFINIKGADSATIKFDSEAYPINLLYKLWCEINDFKSIELNCFEPKNIPSLYLYQSIIQLHRTLQDWYADRKIYHFCGFLFANYNLTFSPIWKIWQNKAITRQNFILELKKKMKEQILENESDGKETENAINPLLNKMVDFESEQSTNWYSNEQPLQKILLLLDVIRHSENEANKLAFLHPAYFKKKKEDKEHIYPCTPTEFKEFKGLDQPIRKINEYIISLNKDASIEKKIEQVAITDEDWENYEQHEKKNLMEDLKTEIHQKCPINSIGNLVLLHESINRGFGNNHYLKKRAYIIENMEKGRYLRPHTFKVFIKQNSSEDLHEWKMADIRKNAENIKSSLEIFFEVKPKNHV